MFNISSLKLSKNIKLNLNKKIKFFRNTISNIILKTESKYTRSMMG